ncbi:golgin subfamily A member 4 isoform 2-T2 [Aplochiton taeniatus]
MFKKLKQKINEEQSPQRNAQSPQQAQVGPGERHSSHTPSLHHDNPASPSDRESGSKGMARSPRGSINGDGAASPQREEPQSFAQKLQLRVPSVESLLRGASRAESLFRSPSKESLVRSSSRDSLTPLGENDPQASPAYDPPSDIESEAEESPGNAEALTKEQMLQRLHRVEKSLANYRGKYSELVTTYRTVQRDKEKTQAILSQSQDKALRRIGELREELQMDQQAKKHLQEDFDAALEEKDQMITVLKTQNTLMKKRLKAMPGGLMPPEGEVSQSEDAVDSTSTPQSPTKDPALNDGEGSSDPGKVMEALQKRVTRQENLLQKCKDMLRVHKERSSQLGSENETLQQQLQERLQELEKMKELHTTEKTKLITQLRDAKNLIEQLEQDKGMVIAETKRQMHETLELKEEEVAQLRSRLQQAAAQKEELQEQKEKSDKSAFEELERVLGVAQKAEEARKQLQAQLEEQVKEVERASEEERKSLQLELTRVKQEVVTIMKKSSEEKVSELEKLHSEALAAKERELLARISQAVEQCKEEFDQTAREREQQTALALEDVELQKAAMETEAEAKVKEIRLELEAARTKILELESSMEKIPQGGLVQNDELSSQMEELKTHAEEVTALEERHMEQLDKFKQEQGTLARQHHDALQELKEKHAEEVANILKDKELQFHAHVEDINQKTLEKLDTKQAELESLSSEVAEVLEQKQRLEEKLAAAEHTCSSSSQALEQRLQEEVAKHNAEIETIKQQHEQSLGGIEKTLKEELNTLKMVVQDKERELQEHILMEKTLKEESENLLRERNVKVKDVEELRETLILARSEKKDLEDTNAKFSKICEEMAQCKVELNNLEHKLVVTQTDCKEKETSLQQKLKELHELENQLLQTKKNLVDQENSFQEVANSKEKEEKHLKKQLEDQKASHEKKFENHKKETEGRIKAHETKFDKFKQKTKEMQEKFKKKLQEKEDSMKMELAKKETELQQKEQQVKEKILEVAQKSSEGMTSAMSELEANHKEEVQKLRCVHKQEFEDLERHWQEKLRHQEEEMLEKYTSIQQEKVQEMEEVALKLSSSSEESEQVRQELRDLKEELVIRETTVQKLQAELKKAAVNLDSLSQGEVLLKEQVEVMERNLNQALNERNSLQDELSKSAETSRGKLTALSEQLRDAREKLEDLEASRCKEGDDLQRKLEESALQCQAKETEFQKQFVAVSRQLDHFCQEIQAKMEVGTNELCERVDGRVKELKERVLYNQKRVAHLKNLILSKVDRICTLEKQLQQQTEENRNLCSSLEQMTAQLHVHTDQIKALTREKECLQKEATDHSQSLSEKVLKIEQLSEENGTISDSVKTNAVHISNLESIINDLKTQLASSRGGKKEAISLLDQKHKEERQRLVCQMEETIKRLEQEKSAAVEQVDTLRSNLSEFKRKAESKFTLNHNTVKSLQARLEDMEREMAQKNEALQSLMHDVDNHSVSKSEMDQALSEKEQKVRALALEVESCNCRLSELEEQLTLKSKECAQLIADLKQQHSIRENEKRELTEQLQQTQEQFTQNGDLVQASEEKLQSLEKENQTCKKELEHQREVYDKMKNELIRSKEESLKATEERLSAENAGKVAELKKKAEQKIGQIRKQLTSQMEEKDQTISSLRTNLGERTQEAAAKRQHIDSLEEKAKTLEESIAKLKEEHEKHLEQVQSDERQERETSLEDLKNLYEEKLSSLQTDTSHDETVKTLSMLEEIGKELKAAEDLNVNLRAEIANLKEELLEKSGLLEQHQATIASFAKPDQKRLEKENAVQAEVCSAEQTNSNTAMEMGNHSLTQEDVDTEMLKTKLVEAKNDKHKIQKDFTRLQKDLRSLRKEHEQELDYLKKELAEESEKRLKLELEDMEMKHHSALKQLMREVNSQMALKEKELETAVKETIAKAQSVEAELMENHRAEANQLKKLIAEKEDDLQRTVKKYEEVLQSREEEMGDRVWQVQKELEDLQRRANSNSQMSPEELQAQLAEKTTLLSEARLREQEFIDRIHSLEDKIKCVRKNPVVTHLGSPIKDLAYHSADALSEPTEFEYLRKVLFEYMMGRETKTMAKVITSILKFPPDQAQTVLDKEDSKATPWLRGTL